MVSWAKLTEDLRSFPGDALQLRAASAWDEADGGFIMLAFTVGEVFGSGELELSVIVALRETRIAATAADEDVPEGAADIIAEVAAALTGSGGASAARSAILRLCNDLCVEVDALQSARLAALGRVDGTAAPASASPRPTGRGIPEPQALVRRSSKATSGAASAISFESEGESSDDDAPAQGGTPGGAEARTLRSYNACPRVEDIMVWDAMVDGLKLLNCPQIEFQAAGIWDGMEGLVEILLSNPNGKVWDQLAVTVVVGADQTRVELKGAQAVPDVVAETVAEVNQLQSIGAGPTSLRTAVCALREALQLELGDGPSRSLAVLGDMQFLGRKKAKVFSLSGHASSELHREIMAVEALEAQIELIHGQIKHLERRSLSAPCLEPALRRELATLRRAQGEVEGEKAAAGAAVQGAMLELTDARGTLTGVEIAVHIDDSRPAQSLRGHGARSAAAQIREALAKCGPWAHYAAFQFATMLAREQELHSEYVCFYHSYSHAALLYEVHAEIARGIFGLPGDSAPLPRLSLAGAATAMCRDLRALQGKGGRDHDPDFRALGLSSSCSVFASSSEAPPLTCFQAGYSCTDICFRTLLVDLLVLCLSGVQSADTSARKPGQALADAVIEIAARHNLPVGSYQAQGQDRQAAPQLTGYMLQIFIHRSIVEMHAYPSQPMGRPLKGSIVDYVRKSSDQADGQARILFHPPTFVDSNKARLFHYCARPLQSCMNAEVPSSRGSLLRELREALKPVFAAGNRQVLAKRLSLQ